MPISKRAGVILKYFESKRWLLLPAASISELCRQFIEHVLQSGLENRRLTLTLISSDLRFRQLVRSVFEFFCLAVQLI